MSRPNLAARTVVGQVASVHPELSLAELYARVPAAEEEDLLAQRATEQVQEQSLREYTAGLDPDPPEPDLEDVDAGTAQHDPPTHAQAVGIVQHLLGAEVLDEQ